MYHYFKNFSLKTIVMTGLLALAACGGGGSSDERASDSTSPTTPTSVYTKTVTIPYGQVLVLSPNTNSTSYRYTVTIKEQDTNPSTFGFQTVDLLGRPTTSDCKSFEDASKTTNSYSGSCRVANLEKFHIYHVPGNTNSSAPVTVAVDIAASLF